MAVTAWSGAGEPNDWPSAASAPARFRAGFGPAPGQQYTACAAWPVKAMAMARAIRSYWE
jgi:hypothetical protein